MCYCNTQLQDLRTSFALVFSSIFEPIISNLIHRAISGIASRSFTLALNKFVSSFKSLVVVRGIHIQQLLLCTVISRCLQGQKAAFSGPPKQPNNHILVNETIFALTASRKLKV